MKSSEIIYVGIRGSVLALKRATGEQVWSTRLKGFGFVHVIVEEGRVFAAAHGEVFCLDLLTGKLVWHNGLKGFGTGLASLATAGTSRTSPAPFLAEQLRRDEEAAAAGAASAAAA
ncbi:Pyrrolo-quinoline quinone [Verrucomicrobia bacterium]|nr:Pyrrolo-quinoline quinone [Verrucomicrobiota bacterium]